MFSFLLNRAKKQFHFASQCRTLRHNFRHDSAFIGSPGRAILALLAQWAGRKCGLASCRLFADFPSKRQEPSHVTHVDVTHNNMHFIKRIDSQRDIDTIIAFVSQRRSGWVQPLAGVPVARLYVCFYDGDKIAGDFGVGPGFFETDLAGDQFRSKDAANQRRRLFWH